MKTDEEKRTSVTIPVSGMSCAACSRRVEKALSKTEGVSEASVNLASGKASVEYDGAVLGPRDLIGVVEGAGYGAEVQQTSFAVTGMSCASCVGRVEKALKKVPGILEVNVNLASERATVEHLPDRRRSTRSGEGCRERWLRCRARGGRGSRERSRA